MAAATLAPLVPLTPKTPSGATRGGAEYGAVVSGQQRNYAFFLCDLPVGFVQTTGLVVSRAKAVLADVERRQPSARVAQFIIGKSSVQPQSTAAADEFDPLNRRHLDVRHISDRWRQTYTPRGFDGLVVLAVVTRDKIPPAVLSNGLHPQHYVLALEQAVTHHFALVECDARVGNETFCTGNLEKRGAPAYVVYVAFKIEPLATTTEGKENAVPVSPAPALTSFPALSASGVARKRGGKAKDDVDVFDLSGVAACLAESANEAGEADEFFDALG